MMIHVVFPDVLARAAKLPGSGFSAVGATVADAFHNICADHDGLDKHLFHANGAIKEHFLLTYDGVQITPDHALPDGAEVKVLLATSGGMDGDPFADRHPGTLTNEEITHYARHITLPGVGRLGQERLKNARVLMIGTGGLGSPISLYLAAAGVGTLGLVDFDVVEQSNLQRQIVHGVSTVGLLKVESARRRLLDLNPLLKVETHAEPLDGENALTLISKYDLVVDGSDNFTCRYIANDACTVLGKPLVSGAIYQFDGQVSVYNHDGGPCYRCLFPSAPPAELSPNCSAGGVIGVLPGVIGLLQATEVVKLIVGMGQPLSGRLLRFDALSMNFDEIGFSKRTDCPDCGSIRSEMHDHSAPELCTSTAPSTFAPPSGMMIAPRDLSRDLAAFDLLDVRDPEELEICSLPGAVNIPLSELESRIAAVPTDRPLCVLCYSDVRAKSAAEALLEAGRKDVRILHGGMKAWKRDVDPDMPIY